MMRRRKKKRTTKDIEPMTTTTTMMIAVVHIHENRLGLSPHRLRSTSPKRCEAKASPHSGPKLKSIRLEPPRRINNKRICNGHLRFFFCTVHVDDSEWQINSTRRDQTRMLTMNVTYTKNGERRKNSSAHYFHFWRCQTSWHVGKIFQWRNWWLPRVHSPLRPQSSMNEKFYFNDRFVFTKEKKKLVFCFDRHAFFRRRHVFVPDFPFRTVRRRCDFRFR